MPKWFDAIFNPRKRQIDKKLEKAEQKLEDLVNNAPTEEERKKLGNLVDAFQKVRDARNNL